MVPTSPPRSREWLELKVTQFKSAIGSKPKQRGTLRSSASAGSGRATPFPTAPRSGG